MTTPTRRRRWLRVALAGLAASPVLAVASCTEEQAELIGRGLVALHMVQRFEEEFGLDIPSPPLVFYTRSCFHDAALADDQCDYAISVVYQGDTAYELLYVADEAEARPRTITNVLRLSGTLDVLAVGLSRSYTSVAADFNTEFRDAQNTINQYHDDYGASIGRSAPILQFNNTNVVISADELTGVDTYDPAAVKTRLTDLGYAPASYDIVVLFNLDPWMQDNASAFRNARYIRVGWYMYERTVRSDRGCCGYTGYSRSDIRCPIRSSRLAN